MSIHINTTMNLIKNIILRDSNKYFSGVSFLNSVGGACRSVVAATKSLASYAITARTITHEIAHLLVYMSIYYLLKLTYFRFSCINLNFWQRSVFKVL